LSHSRYSSSAFTAVPFSVASCLMPVSPATANCQIPAGHTKATVWWVPQSCQHDFSKHSQSLGLQFGGSGWEDEHVGSWHKNHVHKTGSTNYFGAQDGACITVCRPKQRHGWWVWTPCVLSLYSCKASATVSLMIETELWGGQKRGRGPNIHSISSIKVFMWGKKLTKWFFYLGKRNNEKRKT
jgi:hypothetical protein